MSSDPLFQSLTRIEGKIDALAVAVADLSNRVTRLETSEQHRESALDRRFGDAERRFVAIETQMKTLTDKGDATADEVTEARGSVKALRWMLIGALGLGGGGLAVGVADGATAPSVSPEATIAVLEAAASAVP